MGLGTKCGELQANAEAKLKDAVLLMVNKRYSSAYYLAGYAVEMGFKACIAKQFAAGVIPDKSFVDKIHTHDLRILVKLAGLASELKKREDVDIAFATNWAITAQWTEGSRYAAFDSASAQWLLGAIADSSHGVFPWIKKYW